MREPRVPATLQIHEIAPEQCLIGFHTVKVATMDDPALPDSFRSHYEAGKAPRYRQTQHAAMHMAVSFWRNQEACRSLAKMFWPKHGEHMARVHLTFGHGFDFLDPALEMNPEHLTIWGAAANLAAATVDIVPVT